MTQTGRPAKWTDAEREIVRRQYPKYGPNIPGLLGKYSPRAIEMCAYRQGIRIREFWTKAEDEFILIHFPEHGREMYKMLNGRSKAAVAQRANQLGVRQGIFSEWTPSENVRETDIAYLAGFIDGEGTITLRRVAKGRYTKAMVSYCNSVKAVIERCARITDSKVAHSRRSISKPGHSDIYIVNIFRREIVLGLLKALMPYLVAKRPQAMAVIEFLELQEYRIAKSPLSRRELELERICQSLNRKGPKRKWAAL